MGNSLRKVIDWMVEVARELDMFEIGREVVHWLVKVSPKGEVHERGGKEWNWLVKPCMQSKMSDLGRQQTRGQLEGGLCIALLVSVKGGVDWMVPDVIWSMLKGDLS